MVSRISQPVLNSASNPNEVVTEFGIVRKGMNAWAHDGKIGRVVLIVRNRHTGDPSHLVVQQGWLWGRRLLIPLHWAIQIVNDRINLNLRKVQLAHLAEYRSDQQITRDVYKAIYTSPTFMPSGDCATIAVYVRDGVVTLQGNVRDQARRFEAQALANRIAGVQELRNELIGDDELRRRIEQEVLSDEAVCTLDLLITVNLGLIEIRGHVSTVPVYDRIIVLVRQVSGVRAIWDNLVVGTGPDGSEYQRRFSLERQHGQRVAGRVEAVGHVST